MNNNLKNIYNFIHLLENNSLKEKFTYKNTSYWPIVRNCIFLALHENFFMHNVNISKKLIFEKIFKNISFNKRAFLRDSLKPKTKKEIDILFVFEKTDLIFFQNDILYSKYKDNYYKFFSKSFNTALLTDFDNLHNACNDHLLNKSCFNLYLINYVEKAFDFFNFLNFFNENIKLLNTFICIYYPDHRVSSSSIFNHILECLFWENYYEYTFIELDPKLIFTVCYFRFPTNYGICSAGNKLGIPTVDIQHGLPTIHYLNWQQRKSLNRFLPLYYLTWNKYFSSKLHIHKGSIIQPITGNDMNWEISKSILTSKKNIVSDYTLLFIDQGILTTNSIDLLYNIFRELKSYKIIFRFHPRTSEQYKNKLKSYLHKLDLIFHDPYSIDLIHSINQSNIALTSHSECAFKLRELGKITVFYSPNASAHFPEDQFFIHLYDIKKCTNYIKNLDFSNLPSNPPHVVDPTEHIKKIINKSIL